MTELASTRLAFTAGLLELAACDPRVVLVCADSGKVVRADSFVQAYPDRWFDVGIAEQNAVALAAGLASCGLMPFVATYAAFVTMRACEQVRTFVAYPGLNVKLIGANGGLAAGEREGVTHQFFEDLGIVRTIPGITVVAPADAGQVKKAVGALAAVPGPAYLRIGSGRDPVILPDDAPFELGKARIVEEHGRDVAIFAFGVMLLRAIEAARALKRMGIGATVVEVHTLRPLDVDTIAGLLRATGAAVTAEDHNIIGGLGSAIAEVSAEHAPVPLVRVGLRDVYPESGEPEPLLDRYGMGVTDIIQAAVRAVEGKTRQQRGD